MNDDLLNRVMDLISISGESRSIAMSAIVDSEKGNIDEAASKIKQAKKNIHKAHNIQTSFITQEMNGDNIDKSILLIHSQDHFMNALTVIDLAERIVNTNSKIARL